MTDVVIRTGDECEKNENDDFKDEFKEESTQVTTTSDTSIIDDAIIDQMRQGLNHHSTFSNGNKSGNLWSRFKYRVQSIVVMNPRLFSLFLLYKSIYPRVLSIADMYTDASVAMDLFDQNEILLFSLSLLFITFPFIIAWVTSLRFCQTYILNTSTNNTSSFSSLNTGMNNSTTINSLIRKYSLTNFNRTLLNIVVLLYLFPPFGCIIVGIFDVGWVFYDVFYGISSFIKGNVLIIDKHNEILSSMKQFRKIIQWIGESLPQLILQCYMIAVGTKVDTIGLIISLVTSMIHLVYNGYALRKKAKFHGLTFATYVMSVLQLADIPIIKLVPRLPAIGQGKINCVNFSHFGMDKESLGPIIEAISNPLCKLKEINFSIATLRLLDVNSCHMLSSFFSNKKIYVTICQTVSNQTILDVFKALDNEKNGYLNENEFNAVFNAFQSRSNSNHGGRNQINSMQNGNKNVDQRKREIFKLLARRQNRLYFADFWKAFVSPKSISYDITQIGLPIHYIFNHIHDSLRNYLSAINCNDRNNNNSNEIDDNKNENINNSENINIGNLFPIPTTVNEWNKELNNLSKLYHFAIGLRHQDDSSGSWFSKNEENVLFTIIIVNQYIESKKAHLINNNEKEMKPKIKQNALLVLNMCQMFLLKYFKKLANVCATEPDANVLFNKVKVQSKTIEIATDSNQSSYNKQYLFDTFDLCLHLENYQSFCILLNCLIVECKVSGQLQDSIIQHIDLVFTMLTSKVNDINVDHEAKEHLVQGILQQAIGMGYMDIVVRVLPLYYDIIPDDKLGMPPRLFLRSFVRLLLCI